jgi:asparaginyl-tRNA synthetase
MEPAKQVRDIKPELNGQTVTLTGWVYAKRVHGGLIFLTLRDPTGLIQVTIHKDRVSPNDFENAQRLTVESSVTVNGTVRVDPRAPGNVEIQCLSLQIIGLANPDYPIKLGVGKEILLDNRHLHIRSPRVTTILRVRSALCRYAREWFENNGFVEVHCPTFITAACEGGATLFPVQYFKRKAFLSQSVQFYQEAAITALGKVYSIQPSFRAEISRTRRHLTEFWQIEAEVSNCDLNGIMQVQEQLVTSICQSIVENCKAELEFLKRRFKPPSLPFTRITYTDAINKLRQLDVKIEWGQDLGADEERILSKQFKDPFFVTHYPKQCKAFYHMPDPSNPEVTLSADLLAPAGHGEIAGGGQRIHDYNQLVQKIKEFELNPDDYQWYIDLRKYGTVPHSGFGLGVERTLRWILGLPHIRDGCLFPRTPARVYP